MSTSTDQSYVTRLTRASGSNFYYSFLVLPRPKREAIHALYAFCREVDDSVDRAGSPGEARRQVAFWRDELAASFEGRATHPISRSLARHLRAYPIRRADLEAVIDGVAMDITPRRYATFEELSGYCYHVASAVGLACIEIFGYTQPAARDYAVRLGEAFQLTNILRDLGADAARGRVYLPAEDLDRFSCPEEDLRAERPSRALTALVKFEVERTRGLFARARSLYPDADRRTLVAAEIMRAIYEALLHEIERRRHDVLGARVRLSRPRKLAIAARCWLQSRGGPRG